MLSLLKAFLDKSTDLRDEHLENNVSINFLTSMLLPSEKHSLKLSSDRLRMCANESVIPLANVSGVKTIFEKSSTLNCLPLVLSSSVNDSTF